MGRLDSNIIDWYSARNQGNILFFSNPQIDVNAYSDFHHNIIGSVFYYLSASLQQEQPARGSDNSDYRNHEWFSLFIERNRYKHKER